MSGEVCRVKVVVRVRPMLHDEPIWVETLDDHTLQTANHHNMKEKLQYEFEKVHGPKCTQQNIYDDHVKILIPHVINGKNASVLAYGPTGAGKTHTILGTPTEPGVIPRALKGLFHSIKELDPKEWNTQISFSYLEIYNEKVQDLLEPRPTELPIRQDQKNNIFVVGLSEKIITSVAQFNQSFGTASKNRTTAATKLNERSSRSHSILLIKVQKSRKSQPNRVFIGKLYIIDLAGSEDNRRTGNVGVRLKESGAINLSLLALGQVVEALNKGQPCIPYRSSKLTRLLQDSLGGNSHSLMIINLSPEETHYFDTYTTLNFARKSKKIINIVETNEIDCNTGSRKRTSSTDSEKSLKQSKKKKLTEELSVSDQNEPAPYLSPLLRNQRTFEDKVTQKLESLEAKLLDQLQNLKQKNKQTPINNPEATPVRRCKLEETPLRRSARRKSLAVFALNKSAVTEADSTTDNETVEPEEVKSYEAGLKKCQDGLKDLKEKLVKNKESKIIKGPKFADGSHFMKENLETVSSSPLFYNPKVLKRKGFRSSANPDKVSSTEYTPKKNKCVKTVEDDTCTKKASMFNPELQTQHNSRILAILNTGNVKELQSLQTLGQKRAQQIQSWRQLKGTFSDFDSLSEVPGLGGQKFVIRFLKSNLVQ